MSQNYLKKTIIIAGFFMIGAWLLVSLVISSALVVERPGLSYKPIIPDQAYFSDIDISDIGRPTLTNQPKANINSLNLLKFHSSLLKPYSLEAIDKELISIRIDSWLKALAAAGITIEESIVDIFPVPQWFQARLISARDEPELREDSRFAGAYGAEYKNILLQLPKIKTIAPIFENILTELWHNSEATENFNNKLHPPILKTDRWIPSDKALKSSHQYALDVFFTSLIKKGKEEKGPAIYSISNGIVVSTADDWKGSDKASLYEHGGLSPKAGNGVIIYEPITKKYFAYFHLNDVIVKPGQFIPAGKLIGYGGNTGVNARKSGHGGHLHIEIHDNDGPWRSYKIKDFILSIN